MKFNEVQEKARVKKMPPEELLVALDDTIELNDEYHRVYDLYEWRGGEVSPFVGHAAARDVAHFILTGENAGLAWVDFLIEKGLAESRQNWQEWAQPHPYSVYRGTIDAFDKTEHSVNNTYFLMYSVVAALRRLRTNTGWVESNDVYGWRLTPSGIAVADAIADEVAEDLELTS